MLLGLSHLGLRVGALPAAEPTFEALGWRRDFLDRAVRIADAERPLLAPDHPDTQALLLMRHPRGWPAVELIEHAGVSDATPPAAHLLIPGAGGLASDAAPPPLPEGVPHANALAAELPGVWLCPEGLTTPRLLLPLPSLDAGVAAFTALGFTPAAPSGPGFVDLALARPLPAWRLHVSLYAAPGDTGARPSLVRPGPCLVSLLTRTLGADLAAIAPHAESVTSTFPVDVGGKHWDLALAVLPGGLVVELMQLAERPTP